MTKNILKLIMHYMPSEIIQEIRVCNKKEIYILIFRLYLLLKYYKFI